MRAFALGIGLGLIFVPFMTQARMPGAYFGFNLTKNNTHAVERDLRGSAGGGSVRISGKKISVRGNATTANNNDIDLVRGSTRGFGGRLFAGYQVNENFAWELEYNKFYDAKWKGGGRTVAPVIPVDDIINRMHAISINALGFMPIMRHLDLKAGLGVAFMRSSLRMDAYVQSGTLEVASALRDQVSDTITAKLNLGLEYKFYEHAWLVFDVARYLQQQNINDVEVFELGFKYYLS